MNKTMAVRRRGERPFARTWREIAIGEIGEVITGKTPSSKMPHHFGNEMPFVTPTDFASYHKYVESAERYLSAEGIQHLSSKVLAQKSVVVTCIGSDMGKVAMAKVRCITNQQINSIVCDEKIVNPDWVYYCLKNTYPLLRRLAEDGTTMPIINKTDFEEIKIPFPPLPIQRRIAEILGALDDKIECNRRINVTLEKMAMALYKHWFVDFGPFRDGKFVDSELGKIPDGWEIRSLYESANYINGAAFKNHDFSPDNSGLPVIKISELKSGITPQTKFCDKNLDPKYKIACGDILFSWSGQPETSIDIFLWTGTDAWLNQHTFKVIPRSPVEHYFVFYLLKHMKPDFVEIARNKQTTGLGHVTIRDMQRIKVVFPSDSFLKKFNNMAQPLFDQFLENKKEEQTLASTRDYLLPKLLHGTISIGNL